MIKVVLSRKDDVLREQIELWLKEILNISALISGFEAVRCPVVALDPEAVDGLLQDACLAGKLMPEGVDKLSQALPGEDLDRLLDQAVKIGKRLNGVLRDPIYVNDDRDREVVVAQMALHGQLDELRTRLEDDLPTEQLRSLWKQHERAHLEGY